MRRLLLLVAFACACRSSQPRADLLLTGGRVFTADPARPWAETIAIRGNRIVALAQMPAARIIDLHGRVVVPGINDAHVHEPWNVAGTPLDLTDARSAEEMFTAIAAAPGTWISAVMPMTMIDDPALTRDALDRVAPDKAVVLRNAAGHAALLNTAAMRAWNVGGGSGWLYETDLWLRFRASDESVPDAAIAAELQRFAQEAIRYGITSVQSMPAGHPDRIASLTAQTPLRWRLIEVEMDSVPDAPRWPAKYIADGTPIERNAALREPYSDRPDARGTTNFTDDQISRAVQVAARSNQQMLFHASGDRALDQLFGAMRATAADWPSRRLRIEHGDFIAVHLEDAKQFGVIVVQNPSHFMMPDLMRARYGADRLRNFQALRSLIDAGIPVAIGSDGPINPWLNLLFATMHPTNPSQAITREQGVVAYTRGSAYAEFKEREKGTIAPGMLADLAVLSQDVFRVDASELPKTRSVLTIIDGRVVYESQ